MTATPVLTRKKLPTPRTDTHRSDTHAHKPAVQQDALHLLRDLAALPADHPHRAALRGNAIEGMFESGGNKSAWSAALKG